MIYGNHSAQKWINTPGLHLLNYMEGLEMVWWLYQFCILKGLPLSFTCQEGSADGDTSAPLLPIPRSRARRKRHLHHHPPSQPYPHQPSISTLQAGAGWAQVQANSRQTPVIQPGKWSEDFISAKLHRPHTRLEAGKFLTAVILQETSVKSLQFPTLHLGIILTD